MGREFIAGDGANSLQLMIKKVPMMRTMTPNKLELWMLLFCWWFDAGEEAH